MSLISKSGIVTGQTIQAEHVTRIIDALNESGSYDVIATGSFTGSFAGDGSQLTSLNVPTASYALNSNLLDGNDSSVFATTASNTFTGNQIINGDVTITGTASISVLHVAYESASVIYSSGSNQLGDATDDTQTLIGTVIVSGSLNVTGSANIPSITGSLSGTSSFALTASYLDNYVEPFPYTGSAQITGSLGVTGSISAFGSSSILTSLLGAGGSGTSTFLQITNGASGATSGDGMLVGYDTDNHAKIKLQDANDLVLANSSGNTLILSAGNVSSVNNHIVGGPVTSLNTGVRFQIESPGTGTTNYPFRVNGLASSRIHFMNGAGQVGLYKSSTTLGAILDISAPGALSSDVALRVRNSADTDNHFTVFGNDNIGIGGRASTGAILSIRGLNNTATTSLQVQNGYYGNNIFTVKDNATASDSDIGSVLINARIYGGNSTGLGKEFDLGGYGLGSSYGDSSTNMVWLNNQGNLNDGAGTSVISVSSNFYINFQTNKRFLFKPSSANFGINQLTFGTNATNTLAISNGTAPDTSPTDAIQFYSNDITAGNAAPHFRTENGSIIKLYQQGPVSSSQGLADALTNLGLLSGSSVVIDETGSSAFPYTGSAIISGSLEVIGTLLATSSWAQNAVSASYAPGISTIAQTDVIYVDSVNGADNSDPNRGNIEKPYATVEYVLANTNNSGSVTGDTTNGNATITNVSDTTNIKAGQYVTGTNIPYGSVVVSKTSNTITLSKTSTGTSSSVTVTWYTPKLIKTSGNFNISGNLFKDGFSYDFGNSNIIFSTILLNITSKFYVPFNLTSDSEIVGTGTTSQFLVNSANQDTLSDFRVNMNRYYSRGTGYQIDINQYTFNADFSCVDFNASFGQICRIGFISDSPGRQIFKGYFYGLLGGFNVYKTSGLFGIEGALECPSTVTAISTNVNSGYFNGTVVGKCQFINFAVNGNITGDVVCAGTNINGKISTVANTTYIYNKSTIGWLLANGSVTLHGDAFDNGIEIRKLTGTGTITSSTQANVTIDMLQGVTLNWSTGNLTVLNGGGYYANSSIIDVSGGEVSIYGKHYFYNSPGLRTTSNGIVNIFGSILEASVINCSGGRMNNYGRLKSGVSVSSGHFYNSGHIISDAAVTQTGGTVELDGGTLEMNTSGSSAYLLSKTSGSLLLRGQNKLKVLNSKGPLKCTANTSASKDIYNFSTITNCDGTTYGLLFPWSGSAYAANDLVGGTIYENINY